jgi:hypothetical protein
MNDGNHDPETAMQRFEDFVAEILTVTKDEIAKVQEQAEALIDDAKPIAEQEPDC